MKCPNCGNEVSDNLESCPICGLRFDYDNAEEVGTSANTNSQNYANSNQKVYQVTPQKTFNPSSFVGGFILAIIVALVGYFGYTAFQDKIGKDGTYQSVAPIEKTTIEYLSSKEVLDSLIEQENDIQEYLKHRRKPNINKIFETFYRNLSSSVGLITDEGLELVEKEEDSPWYKSTDPETDLFEFSTNDITGTRIDIHYLNKKYSKYLNRDWQKYLKLAEKNREKVWISSDLGISSKIVTDWVIDWQRFLMKHPKFPLNDLVRAELKSLTTNVLYHEYAFDNEKMTGETKSAYEDFLKRVNSTTKEYKIVKKCYNELKNNNYKTSADFYRYLSEYSGQEWHKQMYKTLQAKEDAKQMEAKETRKKIAAHIYFDEKSIETDTDGYVSGVFKQYIYADDKQEGQKPAYKTISIGAFCGGKNSASEQKLDLPVYKYYNFDEMIISKKDEKAERKKNHPEELQYSVQVKEIENGDLYYKTLCSHIGKEKETATEDKTNKAQQND